MDFQFWAAAAILLALYGAVMVRQIRGRSELVPYLFLAAAVALVLVGAISPSGAAGAVSLPVLAFLFSMFVFAVALDRAGVMAHLALWLAARASKPEDLVVYLFVGFGLFSTLVVNDAVVVLMVPFLLHLAKRLGTKPLPLLLVLAFGVTVGSMLTPLGNPQNLLVALSSGMGDPLTTFLRYLLVPELLCLLVGALLLSRWLGPQLRADPDRPPTPPLPQLPLLPKEGWARRLRLYPVLVVFPLTMGALFTIDLGNAVGALPSVPIDVVVAAGAALLLLVQPARNGILARVDWSTLLLFVGLFIVMGGEVSAGVVGSLTNIFPVSAPGAGGSVSPADLGSVLLSSTLGSQVFSNVPWVALSIPTMKGLGYGSGTPVAWIALAAGSTLAGNLTLLGAASNLIIANQAQKGGVVFPLKEFVRYGAPLTVVTIAITWICLVLRI